MTRPAIVIGLGGTGQWVTTYVKKELMEDNHGEMPDNVKLLSFDTWPEQNVANNQAPAAQVITIGNTKLVLNQEFIPLSGNTRTMGDDVVADNADHIGKRISDLGTAYAWFDAPYFVNNVPTALWGLSIGAGQIRQFGRLGFFHHAANIRSNLSRALTAIRALIPTNEQIQVIIIASFAGGTGAGMLLDMAAMCRELVPNRDGIDPVLIQGVFVLPGAFVGSTDAQAPAMQARAFAAWRELNRFMNLGPNYGEHDIIYDHNISIHVRNKPFDQVFLVDADRNQFPFTGTKPENGVFPAIASFISATLDDTSGTTLGDSINHLLDLKNGKIGYSTFGAYSLQIPVTHMVNEYTLQIARDLLKRWLTPEMSNKDGHWQPSDLKKDQNLQHIGQAGKQEILPFMTLTEHKLEAIMNRMNLDQLNPRTTLQSLPILSKVYRLYEKYQTGTYGQGETDEDARGGYCGIGEDQQINSASWLGHLLIPADFAKTPLIDAAGHSLVINQSMLDAEVASTVRGEVPKSKDLEVDPTLDEAERIIKAVENPQRGYIVQHYGLDGGTGTFDHELETLYLFNRERFKQILEIEMLNILNGTVADPHNGLSGRLGYLEDFCAELNHCLEWLMETHLTSVRITRGALNLLIESKQELDSERNEMVENAGKKCVVFFNHPRAHMTQEAYLKAVQKYCEVRKDDKVLAMLSDLIKDMTTVVQQAKKQLKNWKQTLLLAGDSLYAQLEMEYSDTKQDLDNQTSLNQAQKLQIIREYPDVSTNPDAYQNIPEVVAKIDAQMARLRWGVKNGRNLEISCEAFTENGQYEPLISNVGTQHNLDLFKSISRIAWTDFAKQNRLIDEIGNPTSPRYVDAISLGRSLDAHSCPMYRGAAVGIKSALRRINPHSNSFNPTTYITELDSLQMNIAPLITANGYHTSDSTSPHKLTLVQWIDMLQANDFAVYDTLKRSYYNYIRAGQGHEVASRLHIFPAEGNAAFYEHQLPLWLDQGVRELSPRMVLLMTDVEKVRYFFQAYALGLIKHGQFTNRTGRWWRLMFDDGDMVQNIRFYYQNANNDPDPFEVINDFVSGRDTVTEAPISWDHLKDLLHAKMISLRNTRDLKPLIDGQFGQGPLPVQEHDDIDEVVDNQKAFIAYLEKQGRILFTAYSMAHGTQAAVNPGWNWISVDDYRDLAAVGRMMYIETLLINEQISMNDLPNSIYRN